MSNFVVNVKSIMAKKKITQKELAKISGISEPSLSRYLSTSLIPRIDVIENVSKALGVSVGELLGQETNVSKSQNVFQETVAVVTRNKSVLTDQEKADLVKILFGGK